MVSAAARVFALPELLEPILLSLRWYDLFRLLRTNATFQKTILCSKKLGQCMHLDYEEPPVQPSTSYSFKREDLTPAFCYFLQNDANVYMDLDLTLDVIPGREWRKNLPKDPVSVLTISMTLPAKYFDKSTIGKSRRLRRSRQAPQASWNSIKLTYVPATVRIAVEVRCQEPLGYRYTEAFEFAAGTGSLGQLSDVLNRIRRRTPAEHKMCQSSKNLSILETWLNRSSLSTGDEQI